MSTEHFASQNPYSALDLGYEAAFPEAPLHKPATPLVQTDANTDPPGGRLLPPWPILIFLFALLTILLAGLE